MGKSVTKIVIEETRESQPRRWTGTGSLDATIRRHFGAGASFIRDESLPWRTFGYVAVLEKDGWTPVTGQVVVDGETVQ